MPVNEPASTPRWKTGKPLMTRRGRVVVLAAACLVAATIVIVQQRQTSAREESPSAVTQQPQLATEEPAVAPKATPARPAARKPAATARPAATTSARPAASATTLPVPAKSDVTTVVTAPAPRDAQAAPRNAQAVPVDVVTISGCLEQDDERFRLKDTTGEDAPRGRSWRSGFLRRGSATIDVIDESDRHHLQTYVGQRVNVTGTLVDREMQVNSVRIVAISCEEKSA
jgi:hypothetical protein